MRWLCPLALVFFVSCSSSSANDPIDAGAASVARGKYLAESVLSCGDCHTPRDTTGAPIAAKLFAGVECFIDSHPPASDGMGCLHTANLTRDTSGLASFSDAEVSAMLTTGVKPDGSFLSPVMPYWIFHQLTPSDAAAIVAYLRTVPAVEHVIPQNEAPFDHVLAAAMPVNDGEIPLATSGPQTGKSNGRYLAALACSGCHSPDVPPAAPSGRTVDLSRVFQGGRDFKAAASRLPSPPYPADIYSLNLTPDPTGLAGWVEADIVKVLHTGIDDEGKKLCPPMPFGPMGGFAGVTDEDATDIAGYLLGLPAVANQIPAVCVAPEAPTAGEGR